MSGSLRETWSTLSPDKPFRYRFLEGAVEYLYRMEWRLSETMTAFFVLVVVIICPGFFLARLLHRRAIDKVRESVIVGSEVRA